MVLSLVNKNNYDNLATIWPLLKLQTHNQTSSDFCQSRNYHEQQMVNWAKINSVFQLVGCGEPFINYLRVFVGRIGSRVVINYMLMDRLWFSRIFSQFKFILKLFPVYNWREFLANIYINIFACYWLLLNLITFHESLEFLSTSRANLSRL